MKNITTSSKYNLDFRDLLHGFLVAFLGALVDGLIQYAAAAQQAGNVFVLPTKTNLEEIGYVALVAGLAYLGKNFFKGTQVITLKTIALFMLLAVGLSSCKAWEQFTKHCTVTGEVHDDKEGFKTCMECDSLATLVRQYTQQQLKK